MLKVLEKTQKSSWQNRNERFSEQGDTSGQFSGSQGKTITALKLAQRANSKLQTNTVVSGKTLGAELIYSVANYVMTVMKPKTYLW